MAAAPSRGELACTQTGTRDEHARRSGASAGPGDVGDERPRRDARIDHSRLRILLGIGRSGPGMGRSSMETEDDERARGQGARYGGTRPPRKANEQTAR